VCVCVCVFVCLFVCLFEFFFFLFLSFYFFSFSFLLFLFSYFFVLNLWITNRNIRIRNINNTNSKSSWILKHDRKIDLKNFRCFKINDLGWINCSRSTSYFSFMFVCLFVYVVYVCLFMLFVCLFVYSCLFVYIVCLCLFLHVSCVCKLPVTFQTKQYEFWNTEHWATLVVPPLPIYVCWIGFHLCLFYF